MCNSQSLKIEQILGKLLIGRNLKWSVLIGRALIAARGRHCIIPYYRSNEQILGKHLISRELFHHQGAPRGNPLLSLKWADFGVLSDWSRAVSPPEDATGQVCRRF